MRKYCDRGEWEFREKKTVEGGREGVATLLQLQRPASLRWCHLVPTKSSYSVQGDGRGGDSGL